MLRKVPLFGACTDKQLAFIVTQVEDLDFPAGKMLCRQGDSGGDFFVIVSGTAEVMPSQDVILESRQTVASFWWQALKQTVGSCFSIATLHANKYQEAGADRADCIAGNFNAGMAHAL